MRGRILVVTPLVIAGFAAAAIATPSVGSLIVETARGELGERLRVNTKYENGGRVKLHTDGPIEVITQRIEAAPGTSFGWHSHPAENVNVVRQGVVTLYHDETCTQGVEYAAGSSFATHPDEIHLARNEGTTTLVIFSTYFGPKTNPPTPIRVDQPLPRTGCPQ